MSRESHTTRYLVLTYFDSKPNTSSSSLYLIQGNVSIACSNSGSRNEQGDVKYVGGEGSDLHVTNVIEMSLNYHPHT